MKKNIRGISLIALLIVCIIIIIFATVFIVKFSNEYILNDASDTAIMQDFKTFSEELTVYNNSKYSDTTGEYDSATLNATADSISFNCKSDKDREKNVYDVITALKKSRYVDNVSIVNGKIAIRGLERRIRELASQAVTDLVFLYEKAEVDTIVTLGNATINGENPSYCNPIIPEYFKPVETTDATWQDKNNDLKPDGWNKGLVIADEKGNEFVWVPVDGKKIKYEKNFNYPCDFSSIKSYNVNISDVKDDLDENAQITKYGGFYIGRYEAGIPAGQVGIDGTNSETSDVKATPVTKKDSFIWTNISYNNAYLSSKMCVDLPDVKTSLVTGTMWDTVCLWISTTSTNVDSNSNSWGNYRNSISSIVGHGLKQMSGFSEYCKEKNIYDLAGNTWEWTNERYSNSYVCRGGAYDVNGNMNPASFRKILKAETTSDNISYRVALFIL